MMINKIAPIFESCGISLLGDFYLRDGVPYPHCPGPTSKKRLNPVHSDVHCSGVSLM